MFLTAQILMVLWQRKVAVLKYRWNLKTNNVNKEIRPEFEKKTFDSIRQCAITNEPVHYMPLTKILLRRFITVIIIMILVNFH